MTHRDTCGRGGINIGKFLEGAVMLRPISPPDYPPRRWFPSTHQERRRKLHTRSLFHRISPSLVDETPPRTEDSYDPRCTESSHSNYTVQVGRSSAAPYHEHNHRQPHQEHEHADGKLTPAHFFTSPLRCSRCFSCVHAHAQKQSGLQKSLCWSGSGRRIPDTPATPFNSTGGSPLALVRQLSHR